MNPNKQFQELLKEILDEDREINTRNSLTFRKINLMKTFTRTPLIAIRRTAWKSALREFEWFMSGSNNIKDLHPSVHKWWEPWASPEGFVHNNYSEQFRQFVGIDGSTDQINYLKEAIKDHPYSRRSVITTWNTTDMLHKSTPITNCHGTTIQCFVEPRDNTLHLTMYQRSSDMVLGLPHNLIQYWAFMQYLAHHGGRGVGSFTWIGGDCHIYDNHVDMAKRMINESIEPLEEIELVYKPTSEEFLADDFTLSAKYDPIIKESLEMTV